MEDTSLQTNAEEKATVAHEATNEAAHAAKNAEQASQAAHEAQMASAIARAIKEVFSLEQEGGQKRFIDVSRVPLICQAILGINQTMKELKDNQVTKEAFWPVKTLVYGLTATMLSGTIGLVLYFAYSVVKAKQGL